MQLVINVIGEDTSFYKMKKWVSTFAQYAEHMVSRKQSAHGLVKLMNFAKIDFKAQTFPTKMVTYKFF